jgi:hypothetical protein
MTDIPLSTENKWEIVRNKRNKMLEDCNWTQLPDAILSPAEKIAMLIYRQALQELEFIFASPDDVVFPAPPIVISTATTPAIITSRAKLKAARITVAAIPSWATWTQADWNTYFTANLSDAEVDKVTTIALARVALKRQNLVILNLVKLVLAMRDEIWSDL